MAFWEDPSIKALSSGMDALWQKQQVISHNIANVETPGYKAKQVEFKEVLKKAEDGGKPIRAYETVVTEDGTTQARADGNNVQVEAEELSLWKTYVEYSTLTSRMSKKFSTLRYVINNAGKQ
nr:flagellar basal body protein [uncultured Eisenbergiella sp.]